MSAPRKDPDRPEKRPPESPGKNLKERVSFFEKVLTGSRLSGAAEGVSSADVEEFERRLAEERAKNLEHSRLEPVTLRHTPTSPRHLVQRKEVVEPDGTVQAGIIFQKLLLNLKKNNCVVFFSNIS